MNAAAPLTSPVLLDPPETVKETAMGVPALTVTVTVWSVVLTPLDAVRVNVSVVDPVAFWRWVCVGV